MIASLDVAPFFYALIILCEQLFRQADAQKQKVNCVKVCFK